MAKAKKTSWLLYLCCFAVSATLFFLSLNAPLAEQVDHHGYSVEASMSAEQCATCHDGAMAPDIGICPLQGKCHDHPVNRTYPPMDKESEFHSAASVVAAGIPLPDGRVSCISCHDLTNREPSHLAAKNLCLSCHIR